MKKAFTLIELLVVIAIIAILAAILFPVFAQAKAAAKKTSSLSNVKEHALAVIMYGGDTDDRFVPVTDWDNNGAPSYFGGSGFQPWSWLILPYTKSADILKDPQAPGNLPWGGTWADTTQKALAPQYGYNYFAMSPMTYSGGWTMNVTSQTALGAPADTVMFTAKNSTSETTIGATSAYWYGPMTFTSTTVVDAPACYGQSQYPTQYCFGNWGKGGFWDTTYLKSTEAAGAFTGGVSLRAAKQAVVAWADGHASTKPAGTLAAGTNWNPTIAASSVVINDLTKYVWDVQ